MYSKNEIRFLVIFYLLYVIWGGYIAWDAMKTVWDIPRFETSGEL